MYKKMAKKGRQKITLDDQLDARRNNDHPVAEQKGNRCCCFLNRDSVFCSADKKVKEIL